MKLRRSRVPGLTRPADVLLPSAFLISSALGRSRAAAALFAACFLIQLLSLASAKGLRAAFATQPDIRRVQGSVIAALIAQLAGAAVAGVACALIPLPVSVTLPLALCGLLLNMEHCFYEYLYSEGDKGSAALSRGLTSALTLTGLLLSSPRSGSFSLPERLDWPLLAAPIAIAAGVSAVISLTACGKWRPRLNGKLFRASPRALLQTALYPALCALLLWAFRPSLSTGVPFFSGLALMELCDTPFRRSSLEAKPLNRALGIVLAACAAGLGLCAALSPSQNPIPLISDILHILTALLLAAACALTLYGNLSRREE